MSGKVSSIHERVRVGGKDELKATSHNEGWDENIIRKMVLMEGSIMRHCNASRGYGLSYF